MPMCRRTLYRKSSTRSTSTSGLGSMVPLAPFCPERISQTRRLVLKQYPLVGSFGSLQKVSWSRCVKLYLQWSSQAVLGQVRPPGLKSWGLLRSVDTLPRPVLSRPSVFSQSIQPCLPSELTSCVSVSIHFCMMTSASLTTLVSSFTMLYKGTIAHRAQLLA